MSISVCDSIGPPTRLRKTCVNRFNYKGFLIIFLVAKLLYNYLCPSVRLSVCPYVRPSVRPSGLGGNVIFLAYN